MRGKLAGAVCLLGLMLSPAVAAVPVPEAGTLLVARPDLPDPRFREAVVLLIQHGPQGSAGLIVNRPSRLDLAEVLPALPPSAGARSALSYGGPVAPRALLALVRTAGNPPEPAQKVVDAVYLTGSEQLLSWLGQERPGTMFRVFAGFAGWAPGQLEGEMTRGDWQVLPAEERLLFGDDPAGMWRELLQQKVRQAPP